MFPWEDSLPNGHVGLPRRRDRPGRVGDRGTHPRAARGARPAFGDAGEPIWRKVHVFAMERWDGQHDTYYWVEVEPFEPRPVLSPEQLLAENVDTMRWWTYDDLVAAQRAFEGATSTTPATPSSRRDASATSCPTC